jgi:AbrB family looped-hinge helix DNA binding protein
VVIPKALRDRVRLQPGEEVAFELRDEEIVLVARRRPLRLGGRFAKTGMAARHLEDRAREAR